MRKVFFTLIVLLFCFNTLAQEKHLTFKGIPIDGNIHTFANKLKQQGYNEIYQDKNEYVFNGDFSYLYGCQIYLYSNPNNLNIYMVAVQSPNFYSWSTLFNAYKNIINGLIDKYGKTIFYSEIFEGKDLNEIDDSTKMLMLKNDQANFYHRFVLEQGDIYVMLNNECKIVLYYNDHINNKANDIRKQNEL